MAHSLFCHTAILQFLMADISFNVACKELKIVQIAQLKKALSTFAFSSYNYAAIMASMS